MPGIIRLEAYEKQRQVIHAVLDENPQNVAIGLGGSRGSGKSDTTAQSHVAATIEYPGLQSLIIREGQEDVVENYRNLIMEVADRYGVAPAFRYLEGKKRFRVANGSDIRLGFFRDDKDFNRYLGQEYGLISMEEASQHPIKKWDDLGTANRTKGSSGYIPRRTMATNPGGIGHSDLYARFVNDRTRRARHLWVPMYIWDCPATLIKNPDYIKEILDPLPEWQRQQWLFGRWDIIAGQYFNIPQNFWKKTLTFDRTPEQNELAIPKWATWWAGVDYGDAKPFSVHWAAKWKDVMTNKEHVHTCSEIYEANLDLDTQAEYVLAREQELRDKRLLHNAVVYFADPSVAIEKPSEREEQSRSIVKVWNKHGFYPRQARSRNRIVGWKLMKLLMRKNVWTVDSNECPALMNELTTAQTNGAPGPPINEDIQQGTNVADHSLDDCRYKLVSIYPQGYTEGPTYDPITGNPVDGPLDTWKSEVDRLLRMEV